MSLCHLYVLLRKVSIQILFPFFNWIVCLPGVESYEFFIYFRNQTLVWCIIGKYVLSYSWFPFHFHDGFFIVQKLLKLTYSRLFIFSFISLALGDILAKILIHEISEILLHIFSSRIVMVLWFKVFYTFWVYSCVWRKLVI